MFILRLSLWRRKTEGSKMTAKPPDLKRLPPTDPALELNIKRAHYQAMVWFNCVEGEPPPGKDPLQVCQQEIASGTYFFTKLQN